MANKPKIKKKERMVKMKGKRERENNMRSFFFNTLDN